MKNYALTVSGLIFGLIALIHLSRLYFQFPILVNSVMIPLWANVIGFLVAGALCVWMFYAIKQKE